MEKRTVRWGLLRLFLAFFAGVLATVYFLVPGRTGPTVLVYDQREMQVADISRAGDRVSQWGRDALGYAGRAKEYLKEKSRPTGKP